jgi:glutaredoxin
MNFTIYSKEYCPYCSKIIKVMQMKEFNFTVLKLGVDFTREEFYDQFGQGSTFPQVLMGDYNVGGCTETVAYLRENNLI